jgi:hypothetical protein
MLAGERGNKTDELLRREALAARETHPLNRGVKLGGLRALL